MADRYAELVEALRASVIAGPGETSPELRERVCARAAEAAGGGKPATAVPDELAPYVDKVALHAYKVVDGDVERVVAAGYAEDEVFELTVSAALGAALARVDRGLAALRDGG